MWFDCGSKKMSFPKMSLKLGRRRVGEWVGERAFVSYRYERRDDRHVSVG